MKPFLASRQKLTELLALLFFAGVLYVFADSIDSVGLFALGFIWNWAASQEMELLLAERRYRFSTLKLVKNLQTLFLRPFRKLPSWTTPIFRSLPAGVFWSLVVYFLDSEMPWWATFLGSFCYELLLVEVAVIKKLRDEL